jgi:hypothetical protein
MVSLLPSARWFHPRPLHFYPIAAAGVELWTVPKGGAGGPKESGSSQALPRASSSHLEHSEAGQGPGLSTIPKPGVRLRLPNSPQQGLP